MRVGLILSIVLMTSAVQARVFDINKETFSAYFLATGGGSTLGTSAVKDEAIPNLKYSGGVNYNYTGEFGFIYAKPRGSLRFGFEIIKPTNLDSTVTNSVGTELYSASSEILGYVPKLSLEMNLHGNNVSRSFVSFSAGMANITMKNAYTLTSAGQTQFPGVADHGIEAKGSATQLSGSLGYETLLSDTTTVVLEFGYRQLRVDNLQYTKDVSTFGGSKTSGAGLTTVDGKARELNFSGGFISLGFRFYL